MADVDVSFAKLDKERLIELSFLPDGARIFRGDKHGFLSFLNALRKEGETGFCDVYLEVEGKTFPAHRCVLAANSQFFYTMFTSGMRDANDKQIKLCSLTSSALSDILDFFYTREIHIGKENVEEILEAASFLLLNPVKNACSQIMLSSLRLNNCISMKCLADKYALDELKRRADVFIKKNFQLATNEVEFLGLAASELCELISSDELSVEKEEEVFEAVLKWVKHDTQTRAAQLPNLLPCLRFGSLSSTFLEEHIEKEPVLQQCSFCQNFMKQQHRRRRLARWKKGAIAKERPSAKVHNIIVGVGKGNLRTSLCYNIDEEVMYQLSEPSSPSFILGIAVLGREVYCISRNRHHWDLGAAELQKYPLDQSNRTIYGWQDRAGCEQLSSVCSDQVKLISLKGCLYIVGGCSGATWGRVHCYSPEDDVWKFVAPLITPRCQVGAVSTPYHMYVIGGVIDHTGISEHIVERYDPEANYWTPVAPLKTRRSSPNVVATSSAIFAIGGCSRSVGVEVSCEVYKESTDQWSSIASLPQMWNTPKISTALKDEVYVLYRGETWRYEAKKNAWKKTNKLKALQSGFEDFHLASLQLPKFCFQHRLKSSSRFLGNFERSIYDCSSDEEDDESSVDYPPWYLWGDDSSGSDW